VLECHVASVLGLCGGGGWRRDGGADVPANFLPACTLGALFLTGLGRRACTKNMR